MKGSVAFVQGHGNRDLFTGVRPDELFGWRRNVGLLVALLEAEGVSWHEIHAPTLDALTVTADVVILRDARYPPAQVEGFRRRHRGIPVLAMVFQAPQSIVDRQCAGEARALFGANLPVADERGSVTGVFAADHVVVRTKANAEWYADMGYPRERMVLLPHAPMWRHDGPGNLVAEMPSAPTPAQRPRRFTVLFVGENLLRKGFFRLYRAFRRLPVDGRRLLVCNLSLRQLRAGTVGAIPAFALDEAREALSDPTVEVHDAYRTVDELRRLHSKCDLLVAPSVLDVGPNTLVEAWQLGTRVIASDACGAIADLPPMPTVSAPVWWNERGEAAEAFTDRLTEALEIRRQDTRPPVVPSRADMTDKVQAIVRVWREFLPGLLS